MKIKTLEDLGICNTPWVVDPYFGEVETSDGRIVSDLPTAEEGRLMAAAPELYEAAREVLMYFWDAGAPECERELIAQCLAAFEKAGGLER